MTSKRQSYAPVIIMMMFFSVLALDITVPALVLSAMALCKWLILTGSLNVAWEGETA